MAKTKKTIKFPIEETYSLNMTIEVNQDGTVDITKFKDGKVIFDKNLEPDKLINCFSLYFSNLEAKLN